MTFDRMLPFWKKAAVFGLIERKGFFSLSAKMRFFDRLSEYQYWMVVFSNFAERRKEEK